MNRHESLVFLVGYLLEEDSGAARRLGMGPSTFTERDIEGSADGDLFRLFRSLVNVRPARPLPAAVERVQDDFLRSEIGAAGITDARGLEVIPSTAKTGGPLRLSLWQGDITRLRVDAIVNAANSAMLGCWVPCHSCIDNAIHTYAGVQMRQACQDIITGQGRDREPGSAIITPGFNLPSRFVLHTAGPVIDGPVTDKDEELLSGCYSSCLNLADANGCASIAFCCISTGEYRFPNQRAAEIAINTVREWDTKRSTSRLTHVVFNVFKDLDHEIYAGLLS